MGLEGVFVLGRKHTYTILKHTDALFGVKEVPEVNTEKPQHMLMSCEQNAQQNNNINTANKSSENMAKFTYFGMMQMKIACMKNLRAEYILEMLLPLGPETFYFQFAIKKYKD